ncbi:hypothetical protein LINPERHAP1_LOCUS24059 [Linum perenne]
MHRRHHFHSRLSNLRALRFPELRSQSQHSGRQHPSRVILLRLLGSSGLRERDTARAVEMHGDGLLPSNICCLGSAIWVWCVAWFHIV